MHQASVVGLNAILRSIQKNNSLKSLYLRNNGIDNTAVVWIAHSLQINRGILVFELQFNSIDDKWFQCSSSLIEVELGRELPSIANTLLVHKKEEEKLRLNSVLKVEQRVRRRSLRQDGSRDAVQYEAEKKKREERRSLENQGMGYWNDHRKWKSAQPKEEFSEVDREASMKEKNSTEEDIVVYQEKMQRYLENDEGGQRLVSNIADRCFAYIRRCTQSSSSSPHSSSSFTLPPHSSSFSFSDAQEGLAVISGVFQHLDPCASATTLSLSFLPPCLTLLALPFTMHEILALAPYKESAFKTHQIGLLQVMELLTQNDYLQKLIAKKRLQRMLSLHVLRQNKVTRLHPLAKCIILQHLVRIRRSELQKDSSSASVKGGSKAKHVSLHINNTVDCNKEKELFLLLDTSRRFLLQNKISKHLSLSSVRGNHCYYELNPSLPVDFIPNVRDEIGENGRLIGVLSGNTTIRVLDTLGDHVQVLFESGHGWVLNSDCKAKSSILTSLMIPRPTPVLIPCKLPRKGREQNGIKEEEQRFWTQLVIFEEPLLYTFQPSLSSSTEIKVRSKPSLDADIVGVIKKDCGGPKKSTSPKKDKDIKERARIIKARAMCGDWLEIQFEKLATVWVLHTVGGTALLQRCSSSQSVEK